MKVGFTGSRNGMTPSQVDTLLYLLRRMRMKEFHHGDCLGADAEAHLLVRRLFRKTRICIHPPVRNELRAFMQGDFLYGREPYLKRNHFIVHSTDIIIATPAESTEVMRSGTWATIRYAKKRARRTIIITPSGEQVDHWEDDLKLTELGYEGTQP